MKTLNGHTCVEEHFVGIECITQFYFIKYISQRKRVLLN